MSEVSISSSIYVHNARSARSFPSFSCFVRAALTMRLTESVDQPSAKNLLAAPTLVMAVEGLSKQLPQVAVASRPEAFVLPDPQSLTSLGVVLTHLEGSGSLRHGESVHLSANSPENKELPPVHGSVGEESLLASQCELVVKLRALLSWSLH